MIATAAIVIAVLSIAINVWVIVQDRKMMRDLGIKVENYRELADETIENLESIEEKLKDRRLGR